jgi:heme-degrading monooxygenase HmoA
VARLSAIDSGIAYLREVVMPNLPEIQGWVGLSLMLDRASRRCVATTAWESETAMHASRSRVTSLRDGLTRAFGGRVERIEEWDIPVMHRDHPAGDGACTRCTWMQGEPGAMDRAIDIFRTVVLPEVEKIDGFRSASLYVNRTTGRAVGVTVWASPVAIERSRVQTGQIRSSLTRRAGVSVQEVTEFELGFAHLRVPEMA